MIALRNRWVDPRIFHVRADAAKAYMLKRGWSMDPRSDQHVWVFAGPIADDGEPIFQILPTSEKVRVFPVRIEQLISALSNFEDRYARDVLDDMLKEGELLNSTSHANGTPTKGKKKPAKRRS